MSVSLSRPAESPYCVSGANHHADPQSDDPTTHTTTQSYEASREREREKNREQDPCVSLAISRSALHKMQRCPHTHSETYVIPSEKESHTEREKQKREIKDKMMKREKPGLKIKAW